MSRPSMDQVRNTGDYQTVYQWNMIFASFPNIGSYPSTESLNLRCESADLPQQTNQKIDVNIRGHITHRPGQPNYAGTLVLTFVETVDNAVKNLINEWKEAIWETQTGVQGSFEDVQGSLILQQLDRQDSPVYEYTLIGVFLEDFALGTLSSENEFQRPTVTISYDYYKERAL